MIPLGPSIVAEWDDGLFRVHLVIDGQGAYNGYIFDKKAKRPFTLDQSTGYIYLSETSQFRGIGGGPGARRMTDQP